MQRVEPKSLQGAQQLAYRADFTIVVQQESARYIISA
jgi:hypothetical protein